MLAGLILGLFLSFIIIILEPFNTHQFRSNNRLLLLSGFGILMSSVFIVQNCFENLLYFKLKKVWRVYHEIVSTIVFFLFSGSIIFLYNSIVVNNISYTLPNHLLYLRTTVIAMIPILAPLILFLRQKFGERILPPPINSIVLIGENKNEVLELKKDELLFVKAVENYVEITFLNGSKNVVSLTFRQTLSNVSQQAPFLEKCHRSYLVNTTTIREVKGNSQSAKISFVHGNEEIPLSKTYYKQVKRNQI